MGVDDPQGHDTTVKYIFWNKGPPRRRIPSSLCYSVPSFLSSLRIADILSADGTPCPPAGRRPSGPAVGAFDSHGGTALEAKASTVGEVFSTGRAHERVRGFFPSWVGRHDQVPGLTDRSKPVESLCSSGSPGSAGHLGALFKECLDLPDGLRKVLQVKAEIGRRRHFAHPAFQVLEGLD